ncbi:FAD-dependent monooxygenase [Streptomyces sp. NBC_00555]|uniref:FAD-dependent monooxygenase n=1 Tax=Streptomyces sp. NBC_00555 TaxID=2903662 RepID=UPI002256BA40|nr:FAD-dependent monooxygenase [Streptomyces sp. NBC_00555]MCX5010363.1 FAD-dependent monooxygenase [Streptomyces sp. NBC_00555]
MPASPITTPAPLPPHTDVLIVGAGPVGLTLAASLRQLGVDHVLIDRGTGVQAGSRAAALQPRSLEYLERIGVAEHLVAAGERGRGFRVHDREHTLLHASYSDLDTPYPYVLLASQQTTDEHLLRRLGQLGGGVHRGHRFLGFTPDFPGVSAVIADPEGLLRSVSARYLVGCDGLHSAVRTAAGIGFPGEAPEQLYALADVRLAPGTSGPMEGGLGEDDPTFFLSSAGMLLLSPLADGQHRIVTPAAPGSAAPRAADIERLVSERGPLTARIRVAEVVNTSTYRVQERVSERFRAGPVFLAGDAAHTHSPAGGQGMNTGIQDAGNLAWKLHAVLTGTAPAELLDSYHCERHPVASELVAFTSQFAKIATLRDPAAGQRRNDLLAAAAAASGIVDWVATKLAQLDISYAREPDRDSPRVGDRISPLTVPQADLRWTLALPGRSEPPNGRQWDTVLSVCHVPGLRTPLLVRPDGYLAAHGVPAEPAEVLSQLAQHLPLPVPSTR